MLAGVLRARCPAWDPALPARRPRTPDICTPDTFCRLCAYAPSPASVSRALTPLARSPLSRLCGEGALAEPPAVQLRLGDEVVEVVYSTSAGLHKLQRLGGFEVANLVIYSLGGYTRTTYSVPHATCSLVTAPSPRLTTHDTPSRHPLATRPRRDDADARRRSRCRARSSCGKGARWSRRSARSRPHAAVLARDCLQCSRAPSAPPRPALPPPQEPSTGGLLLAAFAADFDSRADARRHSAAQIGLLDAEHDRLEARVHRHRPTPLEAGTSHAGYAALRQVRDVDSPLGRAVLAWLLLRCVGLETTGVKELTAGMWC